MLHSCFGLKIYHPPPPFSSVPGKGIRIRLDSCLIELLDPHPYPDEDADPGAKMALIFYFLFMRRTLTNFNLYLIRIRILISRQKNSDPQPPKTSVIGFCRGGWAVDWTPRAWPGNACSWCTLFPGIRQLPHGHRQQRPQGTHHTYLTRNPVTACVSLWHVNF